MSLIQDVITILEMNRFRGLTNGTTGIVKAVQQRGTDVTDEDYEWTIKAITTALNSEAENRRQASEEEATLDAWARRLCSTNSHQQLRRRLTALACGEGPSVLASGRRSTRKAVAAESAASGFRERRAIEMALDMKDRDPDA